MPSPAKDKKIFVTSGTVGIGTCICDVIRNLGFQAWTEKDGNCLGADIIILPANSESVYTKNHKISTQNSKSIVILWLIHPLLPPGLSKDSLKLAEKIAKSDWRFMLPAPFGEFTHKYIPFARGIMSLCRLLCLKKFKKEISSNNKNCHCCDRDWIRVIKRSFRLKKDLEHKDLDYAFTTTKAKALYINQSKNNVKYIPFGYHKAFGEMLDLERDIDVLFLGRINSRKREKLLDNLNKDLSAKGIKLKIVDKDCFGYERTKLFNRAKIALDLPRVSWDFGPERFFIAMSCGAMLVSEGLCSKEPFKPDMHYIQSKETDLADTIEYYLKDEEKRRSIADNAYEFVTQEHRLEKSISEILKSCGIIKG
jgi:hypothetical protein